MGSANAYFQFVACPERPRCSRSAARSQHSECLPVSGARLNFLRSPVRTDSYLPALTGLQLRLTLRLRCVIVLAQIMHRNPTGNPP